MLIKLDVKKLPSWQSISQVHILTPSGLETGEPFEEDFAVFGLQIELYPMQVTCDNQAMLSVKIIEVTVSYICVPNQPRRNARRY